MRRGTLRVYLGAAPGVGKTYAMLDEGRRRLERGTDVVVGFVETHGRRHTADLLEGLEIVPRQGGLLPGRHVHRDGRRRRAGPPTGVALVDELAHTNVPGSGNEKRWQDIEHLLAAGIDVISTVNIQHLESFNDVVEKITGVPQRETGARRRSCGRPTRSSWSTCPPRPCAAGWRTATSTRGEDRRRARQLLPARQPHRAARTGAAVDRGQGRRGARSCTGQQNAIGETWETRERVVVALTGGPEGETLIRRAARIAARSAGGDLLAVHVTRSDGLTGANPADLARQRQLVETLGGTYHQIVGDDVPAALLEFARAENATQLVLGVQPPLRLVRPVAGRGIGADSDPRAPATSTCTSSPTRTSGEGAACPDPAGASPAGDGCRASRWRWCCRRCSPWLWCRPARQLNLVSDVLLFLLAVVVVALVGGVLPGRDGSAVAARCC